MGEASAELSVSSSKRDKLYFRMAGDEQQYSSRFHTLLIKNWTIHSSNKPNDSPQMPLSAVKPRKQDTRPIPTYHIQAIAARLNTGHSEPQMPNEALATTGKLM